MNPESNGTVLNGEILFEESRNRFSVFTVKMDT